MDIIVTMVMTIVIIFWKISIMIVNLINLISIVIIIIQIGMVIIATNSIFIIFIIILFIITMIIIIIIFPLSLFSFLSLSLWLFPLLLCISSATVDLPFVHFPTFLSTTFPWRQDVEGAVMDGRVEICPACNSFLGKSLQVAPIITFG